MPIAAPAPHRPQADTGPTRRALVVDDDPQIRDLFTTVLRRVGFEVEVAGDGAAAIRQVFDRRPDIVTLDLAMPELDGYAVIERMREIPHPPRIVVVSGVADAREKTRSLSNVAAFVPKPLRPSDLVAACELALGRPQGLSHADVFSETDDL